MPFSNSKHYDYDGKVGKINHFGHFLKSIVGGSAYTRVGLYAGRLYAGRLYAGRLIRGSANTRVRMASNFLLFFSSHP